MREIDELNDWASRLIGKYDTVVEGFDAYNPLPKRIPKSELDAMLSKKTQDKSKKTGGPSPEIAEKLRQLRAEFAAKSGITEADQPPAGGQLSPLSATTREQPRPNQKAVKKRNREEAKMRRFMGHKD